MSEESRLEIPTKRIKSNNINPKRLILSGKPKVGKTTLMSQLDDCLMIDLEQGMGDLEAMYMSPRTIEELRDICRKIYNSDRHFKYLAIDTITKLEEWCEWEATENYMNTTIGKKFNRGDMGQILPRGQWESVLTLPNGAGYYYLREAVKKWLNVFDKLADHIIIIAHIKDKFINEMGKEVNVNAIDLTGKLSNIVCASADAIGYLFVDKKTKDLMITFDSKYIEGGARQKHLKGATFPVMEFDDNGNIKKNHWDKIFI